jgi:bifunctional UDP-N-acetylglucosamine pyrophosphorylase / glucosamine-1-phosphate N-acetyltransferase
MIRVLIVPAAGRGTRLGASTAKILVAVNGKSMLRHLLDLYAPFVDHVIVVADPPGAPAVEASAREGGLPFQVEVQGVPTGMLDAILIGARGAAAHRPSRVWITWGDQIAVHPDTLARLARVEEGSEAALPVVRREAPYIHFARDASARIHAVLQRRERDVMPPVGESDMGVFSLSAHACFDLLPLYARAAVPGATTGERNFLPFIAWVAARGAVTTCAGTDPLEAVGINTPEDLAAVAAYLAQR